MNFIIIITIFLFIFVIFLLIKNIILQINFNKKYSLLKTNKFFYIKNIDHTKLGFLYELLLWHQ